MKNNVVLFVLVALAAFFVGALFFGKGEVVVREFEPCPACVVGDSDLRLTYLYPEGCVECDLERVEGVAGDAGVPISFYSNDVVGFPQVLMTRDDISTIGAARNDFNILSIACLGGSSRACDRKSAVAEVVVSCLEREGLSPDSVVYFYGPDCKYCDDMKPDVDELEGAGYSFVRVFKGDVSAASECLKPLLNYVGGIPQVVCPSSGASHTGKLSFNELERFADDCGA